MKRYKPDKDDFCWEDLLDTEEQTGTLRFRVSVDFFLDADGHEEAQAKIHELIKEGILALVVEEDQETGYAYDVVDCEIAELDM